MISESARRQLLVFQRNEITEHHVYRRLAALERAENNRNVLERIAEDELRHYKLWQQYTHEEPSPDRFRVVFYVWLARVLGLTFALKRMEAGETDSGSAYRALAQEVPNVETIAREEDEHEAALLAMLDEERLRYVGSVVLGLNDALVELTGALAGFSLAFQRTNLVALAGVITGLAAAFSMAASEYLSTKTENAARQPLKAAAYTGVAYLATVGLLILPYLLFARYIWALAATLALALLIIAAFNYYISVVQGLRFRSRFAEMAGLSFGVAGFSFLLGALLRRFSGIEL